MSKFGQGFERRINMKMFKNLLFALTASVAITLSMPMSAQTATTTVHGKILNPAGSPFSGGGEVQFTKDKNVEYKDEKILYKAPVDPAGTYSAAGITPGDYFVYVIQNAKTVDRLDLTVKAGETDKTLDFDMTRAEYLKQMTPEQLKALEDFKKHNAEAMSANVVINNLNATLKTVRADLAAAAPTKGDVSADVTSMKQAVDAKSDVGLLWLTYGDTLTAQGDHTASVDKKSGKSPMSDDEVLKFYSDAVDAYKKAIDLDGTSKKPNPAEQAVEYNEMGNALARSGKAADAASAFDNAVKIDPSKAGMYYNNEAAVLFNAGQIDPALAAANQAIAADPNRPDPYFIKGQALVTKSAFDAKTNKLTPPPGCIEAYSKFLELAPNDPKVGQVKEVLESLGAKVDTKYKAGKK
jgi:tetratricopeptide (TPR) repeat protein